MKKLMEAELDSSAAAKQTASLKETLKKLEVCVCVCVCVYACMHAFHSTASFIYVI